MSSMRKRALPRPALDAMTSSTSSSQGGIGGVGNSGQNPFSSATYAPPDLAASAMAIPPGVGATVTDRPSRTGDGNVPGRDFSMPSALNFAASGVGGSAVVAQSYKVSESGNMLTLGTSYHVTSSGVHEFRGSTVLTGSTSKLGKDAATAYQLGVQAGSSSVLRCRHIDELDFDNGIQIGRGSSGKVYNVLHVPTGLRVCVKQMMIDDARHREEVKRELDSLHKAPSEFIVDFYGAFFHNDLGVILLVIELMEGSLLGVLQHKGRLTEEQCKAFTIQVVHGLTVLHDSCHVIHRDIKPANLLYHRGGHVKITDFGVSTGQRSQDPHSVQTFVGSILYMSPERLEAKSYGYDSDLWSLGITLCEAATGHHPYQDEFGTNATPLTFWSLLQRVMQADPIRHRSPLRTSIAQLQASFVKHPTPDGRAPPTQSDISDAMDDFVASCMRFDRSERPTAAQLLQHPWLQGMTMEHARRVVQDLAMEIAMMIQPPLVPSANACAALGANPMSPPPADAPTQSSPPAQAQVGASAMFTFSHATRPVNINSPTGPCPDHPTVGGGAEPAAAHAAAGSLAPVASTPSALTPEEKRSRSDALLNDLLSSLKKRG